MKATFYWAIAALAVLAANIAKPLLKLRPKQEVWTEAPAPDRSLAVIQ